MNGNYCCKRLIHTLPFSHYNYFCFPVFTVVQSLSHGQLFVTPWTAACQFPLSTISRSLLRFMSIESVKLSNHLILCCALLLLPSIFASIRVFPSASALLIRWLKYWSFSVSISPSNEYSGLISFRSSHLVILEIFIMKTEL